MLAGNKDWKKVHNRNFSKMDSLSTYLEKRKQRQEALTNSTQKTKLVLEQTRSAIKKLKEIKTPPTISKVCSLCVVLCGSVFLVTEMVHCGSLCCGSLLCGVGALQ